MDKFLRGLMALMLLAPGQALSDRPLEDFQVGDAVHPDESISIGPRAVRLPQGNWQLVAKSRSENRNIYGTTKVTTGVFAYIDGTRTLAFIRFSASEDTLPADGWRNVTDCSPGRPVRFRDGFENNPRQPECHEVRLLANFLGTGAAGHWVDARQRLSELGAGWSPKQFESTYSRFIWGDSFRLDVWANPRLFAPKGNLVAPQTNDDVAQAFVDWSRKQVEQLRPLTERKVSVVTIGDLPKPEETAVADLPPTQVRPSKTDDGPVSDLARFPCKGGTCPDLLKKYLERPLPRALVVAKGRAFSYTGGEDPLAYAMDLCRRQAESPESCRMYAVNNELVWKPE